MKKIFLFAFCLAVFCLAADLDEIRQKGEIKIGVRTNLFPFAKLTSNGEFEGFEVELAKKIGYELLENRGKVKLVGVNAKQRIEFLQNGSVDIIIASFAQDPEREKVVDFSIPYFSMSDAILTHKNKQVSSLNSVFGEKILAVPGTTSYTYLTQMGRFQIIDCKNSKDCFTRLKAGEADYYAQMIQMVGVYPLVDKDYVVSLRKIGEDHYLSVGLPKNTPKLKEAVNKTIIKLSKEGFFQKAYSEIFEPFYRGTLDKKYFLVDSIYDMFF
ncbi:transporter substrate-binding domain-containing protein [Campylobacter sp. FMV-PI01]|uniref:Transporter substrate-binding domain-containing protein n=1 Tax=Campylobacter portucalensis TaxID=2608384 RepID=A0A6L5WGS6_9BACT|nr:transporter substrate-binding domain-containing protein [Campylobacter portucalensis]MSN96388.1 transporter substrate-binding domain-containing protein [Campylobacter portucalensis]